MGLSLQPPQNADEEKAHTLIRSFESTRTLNRAVVDTAFLLSLIDAAANEHFGCGVASRAYLITARAVGQLQKAAWYWSLTMIHHHPASIVTPAFRARIPGLHTLLRNVWELAINAPNPSRAALDAALRATVPLDNDAPGNTLRLTLVDYTGARAGYVRLLRYNGL